MQELLEHTQLKDADVAVMLASGITRTALLFGATHGVYLAAQVGRGTGHACQS
jgi:hypothetical protein